MKKWLSVGISTISLIALAAVGWLFSDYRSFQQVEDLRDVVRFGYAGEEAIVKEELTVDELLNYESAYGETASTYYRDASGETSEWHGTLAYNAVLYAFDQRYDYICVPADFCDSDQLFESACYAVFDHPLLEENMPLDIVEVKYTYRDTVIFFYELTLPTNDAAHQAKKLEALERARQIVAEQSGG